MSNGTERSRLAEAWRAFPEETKVDLIVSELDRVHDRITDLRAEMREGFLKVEQRQNRSIGLLYTMIGGIVVGLVLLVVQLAPH